MLPLTVDAHNADVCKRSRPLVTWHVTIMTALPLVLTCRPCSPASSTQQCAVPIPDPVRAQAQRDDESAEKLYTLCKVVKFKAEDFKNALTLTVEEDE